MKNGYKRIATIAACGIVGLFSFFSVFNFTGSTIPKYPNLLTYVDSSGYVQPVNTVEEWYIKRAQIIDSMEAAMGPLPDTSRSDLPPFDIQIKDTLDGSGYTRYTIFFTVAKGERLPAYLYIPVTASKHNKRPAMLALHPTGKLGKKIVDGQGLRGPRPNRAYAKELAQRGYVVIAPDYPGFGDLKDYNFDTDRYLSGTMKSIFNGIRSVDLLQTLPEVDDNRIGVIGHSLGGHGAIFQGAFDKRLKVIVSSSGWTLMHYYKGGNLMAWSQEVYMPLIRTKYDLDPDKVPFDFDEVIAALAPRAFFSSSPVYDHNFNVVGVVKGIAKASKVYQFLGAENKLEVYYPLTKHDFSPKARKKAYRFIGDIFNVTTVDADIFKINPTGKTGYSYLDNFKYLKRIRLFAKDTTSQKDIVMLGNSLTERGHWKKILGRTDVANRGIGSDITAGYIKRLKYVFNLNPKICFIEGGVNDLAHDIPRDTIIQNLATLIDTLRSKEIIPVLTTASLVAKNYQSFDPNKFNHKIKLLNDAIQDLADRKGVVIINLNPMITNGNFLLKKYAVSDGIHYTAMAYSVWETEIAKVLAKLKLDK